MRIGFDAKRIFHNSTGLGNYGRNLIAGLEALYATDTYLLYTTPNPTIPFQPAKAKICFPRTRPAGVWRIFSIIRQLVSDKIDIYHGLSNELPLSLRRSNIRSVVSIHDVIFIKYPSAYARIDRWIYHQKTKFAIRQANLILTSSASTAADLALIYGADPKKMRVLFPAIDQEFYGTIHPDSVREFDIPDKFFLFVGMGNERKNLEVVIAALGAMSPEKRFPVVVVGGPGSYRSRMEIMVQDKGLSAYFVFIGACSNQALHTLYSKAIALIYASLYEGFGMPVAEALVCDCPVIASDSSSIPEAGGEAAVYFPADDADTLQRHMCTMSTDSALRESCIKRGMVQRESFNPEKLTHALMHYYREVMEV